MIKNDFKIDFEKKKITYVGNGEEIYNVSELYLFLQDLFDEAENMKHEIPIIALSMTQFQLINGWAIDKESLKHLKSGTLTSDNIIKT